MRDSYLTKLRRKRARINRQLDKLEPLLADYRAKLTEVNAAIWAIAPELILPPRRYQPSPYFRRGELPRIAMNIMRQAGEPLATRTLAARCLAAKDITLPDKRALKRTRTRLQQILSVWGRRGLVVKVGNGRHMKRTLAKQS